MTDLEQRIFIGALSGIIGFALGYFIGIRRHKQQPKLSPLQVLAVFIFAGYVAFAPDPSDVVAVAIIALIGGEIIGSKIAEQTGKLKK